MTLAEIGSVLGGRYRLVELLGQGGMATVYRATDAQLGRDVAVKVLRPEYGRDPDFIARFRLEAQSVASLSSPNIVIVHDFGMDTAGPFIVMDLVPGEDLATVLRRVGTLPPTQAARIASEVARALAAAHARGIVHRDIKPGNILLAKDGRVLVTDFGIARALAEAQMTLPGMTMGSVQYMSPEQARGEPATERSDIYSLGVVLFEMLAGRRPFEGDSAAAIAVARLTPPVPMPSSYRAGIPPVLEAICRKAMAIDPAERFQTATAMAAALDDEIADRPVPVAAATAATVAGAAGVAAVGVARANPPAPMPYPPDAYAGGGGPPASPPVDSGGGAGPWGWVAGLLGLGLLVVIGFIVFRLMSGGPAPTGSQVVVPNFVGQTLDQAQTLATAQGLVVSPTKFVTSSDQPEGTVTEQDPQPNAQVAKGSTVSVTVVTGKALVAVPDLRNLTQAAAITALVQAQLTPGAATEAADPEVPKGSVISSSPSTGVEVAVGTTVDYLLSTGPAATPTPTPSPTPSPTPTPTPTPAPTPTPTPAPTPTPLNTVGEYRCQTLGQAKADIAADGFVVGTVTPQPAGYTAADDSFVFDQLPLPGKKRAPGTNVDLSVYDPASYPYPTCPPTP